ncbi:MAG: hypothetical protein Fur0037_18950 [Planctomycetota bacterium]
METPYRREPGYAERYRDRRFATRHGPGTDRRERRAIRTLLARIPDKEGPWLDVPSGAGRLSEELPGPAVLVDRDRSMLAACRTRGRSVCASALALPFPDGAFHGALCMRLLQHIPSRTERVRILAELRRVARGPLIVSFFDAATVQHVRRVLRRATGKPVSGRCAITRAAFADEVAESGSELACMIALRRFVSEQTLALLTPPSRARARNQQALNARVLDSR